MNRLLVTSTCATEDGHGVFQQDDYAHLLSWVKHDIHKNLRFHLIPTFRDRMALYLKAYMRLVPPGDSHENPWRHTIDGTPCEIWMDYDIVHQDWVCQIRTARTVTPLLQVVKIVPEHLKEDMK